MDSNENYQGLLAQGLAQEGGEVDLSSLGLQNYEILHKLGQGGMGSVYLARDLTLDRQVAMKVFDSQNIDPVSLERFQQESHMMAKVHHPNVVSIYGVVTANDESQTPLCLVLEYVAGGDLGQMMARQGPLSPSEVLRITLDICDGLAEIHGHSIVHRDLKPANILLTPDGKAKVADLGIAMDKMSETLTMTGAYVGSMAYVAPEQMSQTRNQIDARTDLWALGVLMYEMLTGATPQATLESDLMAKVPAEFKSIVRKCLKQNPQDRYANVLELKQSLTKVGLGGEGRWKIYAAILAVLIVVLGIGGMMSRKGEEPRADVPSVASEEGGENAPPNSGVAAGSESKESDLIHLLGNPLAPDIGIWTLGADSLTCAQASRAACISFPVEHPGDSYDISLEFVRNIGKNSLAVFLPTSIGSVTFDLDGWNTGVSGIQSLDGKSLQQHPQVFQFLITNGKRYRIKIQVRRESIQVLIDGKDAYTCSLVGKKGRVISLWDFPRKYPVSVGAWASSMTFRNIKMKKVP